MLRRVVTTIIIVVVLGLLIFGVIAYGRGYRFNFGQKSLTSTGILSASSYPDKASVFIDNKLVAATNASISHPPGWYNIRITREGYQAWEKKIRVQGEVVSQIDALLIPTNPSLRALTVNGVFKPILSPTGTKVAYIISAQEATPSAEIKIKNGIWVLDLRTGPLGNRSQPKQIYKPITPVAWQDATLYFSPDEKQIVVTLEKKEPRDAKKTKGKETIYRVLAISPESDNAPIDITTTWNKVKSEWEIQKLEKEKILLSALPNPMILTIKDLVKDLKMSPDETKVLYLATNSASLKQVLEPPLIGTNPTEEVRNLEPNNYYIYDIKEDRNYPLTDIKAFPIPSQLFWYTDSKHIVMIENVTIAIIDYDGTNKRTLYGGPFMDGVVYPWPAGGQLVILTNLNNPQATPNLYELDLR